MTKLAKLSTLTLAVASFVFLTGFHGGCRKLTPEEKAKRIERHSETMVEDVMDDIDATDDQRARVEVIRTRLLKQGLPMIAKQEEAKKLYHQQWASASPDRDRVHAVIDERAADMTALFHAAADGLIELHQILTLEQRKELAEMWE